METLSTLKLYAEFEVYVLGGIPLIRLGSSTGPEGIPKRLRRHLSDFLKKFSDNTLLWYFFGVVGEGSVNFFIDKIKIEVPIK